MGRCKGTFTDSLRFLLGRLTKDTKAIHEVFLEIEGLDLKLESLAVVDLSEPKACLWVVLFDFDDLNRAAHIKVGLVVEG